MGKKTQTREAARHRRKARIRDRIIGTPEKPRLCVHRSHRFTTAQLVSDDDGRVLASASTKSLAERPENKSPKSVDCAKALGLKIAELAKEKNIKAVVFDRNGYIYHGRVAAVATGAREGGLEF
ncbi:MAG: 50S ribosomal protein L18 [Bdellovibrionota bacterium]